MELFITYCHMTVQNLKCKLENVTMELSPAAGLWQRTLEMMDNACKMLDYPFRKCMLKKVPGFVVKVR